MLWDLQGGLPVASVMGTVETGRPCPTAAATTQLVKIVCSSKCEYLCEWAKLAMGMLSCAFEGSVELQSPVKGVGSFAVFSDWV